MKYCKLAEIVNKEAKDRRDGAGASGAWDDGGQQSLLDKLKNFEWSLIVEYDLRPSEIKEHLYNKEVGEPIIFKDVIEKVKLRMARDITL